MQIKSSRPASLCEAKEILAKRKEEGELGYEQNQALDNSERFAASDSKKTEKLAEKIAEIGKFSMDMAIKITDIRPDNSATLRAILVKDRIELAEEDLNQILKELA